MKRSRTRGLATFFLLQTVAASVVVSGCGSDVPGAGDEDGGAAGSEGGDGSGGLAGERMSDGGEAGNGDGDDRVGGSAGAGGSAGVNGDGGAGGDSRPPLVGCDAQLEKLDLGPNVNVTLVKSFQPGDVLSLISPAADATLVAPVELCLVKLMVGPGNPGPATAASTSLGIGIEIWLPTRANWNERYEALGNGGFAGGAEIASLTAIGALRTGASALMEAGAGFVTSINDGGHTGWDGSFGMNPDGSLNLASLGDYAERASHEMAVKTKALIQAFYGKEPKFSYFSGCSGGGREGLMEVQRHPEDFDGVLAGAPALYFDRLNVADLWPQIVMQVDLGGPMSAAKLGAVTVAANAACGKALTGEPDGYISDPSACRYDPTTDLALLCTAAGGTNTTASCLTLVEATAMNKIWYGPTSNGTVPVPTSDNGRSPNGALANDQLWFGVERGTRLTGHFIWDGLAGQLASPIATDTVALALGDPAFAQPSFLNASGNGENEWRSIDYAGATSVANVVTMAHERLGGLLETADSDLGAFAARGGRLLMWHGTSDSLIPPQGSVRYYEAVAARAGSYAAAQQYARFYLGPGFDHCFGAGSPGSNPPAPGTQGDPGLGLFGALRAWVEGGHAPNQLAAQSAPGVTPVRVRPWCLYPTKLKYVSGDVNAGTFACE